MTVDDKTLRGVPPGSFIGPFSAAEIAAAGERIAERDRLEAIAAAAEIKAGWLAVHERAGGPNATSAPAKANHGWSELAARHNEASAKADVAPGTVKPVTASPWAGFLPTKS